MSSETALTGRLGKFVVESTLVARTTKWDVSPVLATKSEWGDSDSGGYTNRAGGRKDCTFATEGKFDTTDEQYDLFQEDDIALSVLWMDTTRYWYFTRALCLDFKLSVNIDTEEVIGWTSGWGADGIYYRPGQSGAPVATLPT
jgi:hypothetical protein